ncbi:adenosine receptor A2a-like [Oculina patagonica]
MKQSSCEAVPHYFPLISEVEDLYWAYIVNCILNNFLSYTAIMLNIVTLHVIRKTSSLPKTLKTLLLSLAVSDVGVGLLAQPLYTSLLVKWFQQTNPSCSNYKVFLVIMLLFSLASLFGVVAVSVDRFLAIHFHLRYRELVTYKRVVAVVMLIWVLSAFFSLTTLWVAPGIRSIFLSVSVVVLLLFTTMVYIRIYLAVRRHKNQIQALQVNEAAQTTEMTNFASLVKSAVGIFYVYLVFFVCYSPFFICLAAIKVNGPSIPLKRFSLFSWTLVFLNSSLNPIIYCWKMRHVRHAVMDILRNMPRNRNRGTSQ